MTPALSIIIVNYNAGAHLARWLESLAAYLQRQTTGKMPTSAAG